MPSNMTLSLICFSAAIGIFAFLATFIILKMLIPVLKSHKIGQKIYDIGPRWHKSKEGTPIMGGLGFIIPAFIGTLLFTILTLISGKFKIEYQGLSVFALALCNGAIGFIDDYTKLIKKQNQGLKAWQKLVLQLAVATLFVFVLAKTGRINTELYIPFAKIRVNLSYFYYVFLVLFIAATVNSVNLTDGIDGLAGSVTSIICIFFLVWGVANRYIGIVSISALTLGGCGGFLVYNFYPARIFMGDTGSLFLGGVVAGLAISVNNPLILILAGFIYYAEELSVILQVGFFKLTHGKRLFKMAPIHHHFEKCGWSEIKIVIVFSAVTLIGCVAAWFGM